VIDLANGSSGDHSRRTGRIAVIHANTPADIRPDGPAHIEFFARLPADLHCGHCQPSEVTALLGAPGCVAGAFLVTHQVTCPALAAMLGSTP